MPCARASPFVAVWVCGVRPFFDLSRELGGLGVAALVPLQFLLRYNKRAMAILDSLNIPAGLEELWQKVLALKPNNLTLGVSLTSSQQHYAKKKRTAGRSYIPIFAPTYDALTLTQKTNWAAYWVGLPFGDHVGANGWPGSGFSAFLYVNAPRYKIGQDLLLDAPGTDGNLIPNSNFALDPFYNDWFGLYDADWIEAQHVMLSRGEGALYYEVFDLEVGQKVRFDLRCKGLGPWADNEVHPDIPDNGGRYDFLIGVGDQSVRQQGYARNFKKFSVTHTFTQEEFDNEGGLIVGLSTPSGWGIGCGYVGLFAI